MQLCTLANEHAVQDIKVLFETLTLFQKDLPHIHVLTDTSTRDRITELKAYPTEKVHYLLGLERYSGLNRRQMEAAPGLTHPTLFGDFTAEKCRLLEVAGVTAGAAGLLFVDADICFLGSLPEIPKGKKLGLSPHMIRKRDTDRFGIYNAGFLWTAEPVAFAAKWREACKTSRFFEQGCLEDLYTGYSESERFEFPKSVNYGWWRMLQSDAGYKSELDEWGLKRSAPAGLSVGGNALESIHTHWSEKTDEATLFFNMNVYKRLLKVRMIPAVAKLVKFLEAEFPHLRYTTEF
jgi:hypothetical protein